MATQHYVDNNGVYIGGFGDGAIPPTPSTLVDAPKDARDTWVNGAWVDYIPNPTDFPLTPFQFGVALRILGLTRDTLAALVAPLFTDPLERAVAIEAVYSSPLYNRDNPLFNLVAPLINKTPDELDVIWLSLKDITGA